MASVSKAKGRPFYHAYWNRKEARIMTKSPAFQFYPDKWQTDTRRLSWEAKGIYHELMCVVWLQFQETCSFPDNDEFISSEIGCSIDEWKRAKAELMNPLRPIITKMETNRLLVGGLLKEAEKQRDRRESLRQNGKLGGRPKNQKVISEEAKPVASGNQKQSLPSPTPSPTPSPIKEEARAVARPAAQGTDEDWRRGLAENPAYLGINMEVEFGKMEAWCAVNRKMPSRRRFLNWLNRAERPMHPGEKVMVSAIDKVLMKRNMDELEAKLRALDGNYESHASWSAADIAERKRLKGLIAEIKTKLGMVK